MMMMTTMMMMIVIHGIYDELDNYDDINSDDNIYGKF